MAISKHLLFSVLIFLLAFLLASSHPEDNKKRPPPRRPPPPPRRPPPPPSPRPSPPPPPRSPPPPTPSPPPPSPPPKPQPGFDYFKLALQWPNSLCFASYMCKPPVPKQQYFTIHGLWPQKNDVTQPQPSFCDTKKNMTNAILNKKEFKDDLLEYWPNLTNVNSSTLWKKQWNKHGSCSSDKFSPEAYLRATIALGKKYGPLITKKMEERGIKPDGSKKYNASETREAIKIVTNTEAIITCGKPDLLDPSGELRLEEIRLCVKADGKTLQDCTNANPEGECKKGFIFPPPWDTNTTHSRFPSFLSSMLDVEEAVGI